MHENCVVCVCVHVRERGYNVQALILNIKYVRFLMLANSVSNLNVEL